MLLERRFPRGGLLGADVPRLRFLGVLVDIPSSRLELFLQKARLDHEALSLMTAFYESIPRKLTGARRRRGEVDSLAKAGVRVEENGRVLATGPLSPSCQLCLKGKLFFLRITLECPLSCFFCFNRAQAKGVAKTFSPANADGPAGHERAVMAEIARQGSGACAIYGGEPLVVLDRTLFYVRALKRRFGPRFRVHLYTNGLGATSSTWEQLRTAGLDEVRFDLAAVGYRASAVKSALGVIPDVGVEIPMIPGDESKVEHLIQELDLLGVRYLNLDELSFSYSNLESLKRRGLAVLALGGKSLVSDGSIIADNYGAGCRPAAGSEDSAFRILRFAAKNSRRLAVYYCSWKTKRSNKFLRRLLSASRSRRPYERVTKSGLLEKLLVFSSDQHELRTSLGRAGIPSRLLHWNKRLEAMETHGSFAALAAREHWPAALVRCFPFFDFPVVQARKLPRDRQS